MFKKLLGAQLVDINESQITIIPQNSIKPIKINIKQYEGDCCGYNFVKSCLLFDPNDTKENPIITNIELKEEREDCFDGHTAFLTFFGISKAMNKSEKLATLNCSSSSGSGYEYGACVVLECEELDLNMLLSEW